MFISLRCPNCGGKLEIEKTFVDEHFIEAGGNFIYRGTIQDRGKARCIHCGSEFVEKQAFERYKSTVVSVSVEGSIQVGGDFVGGDKVTININYTKPEDPSQE